MDYPQEETEFYALMERKIDELDSLDISEEEQNDLYRAVDETIQGFEKSKSFHAEQNFIDMWQSWEGIYAKLEKIEPKDSILKKENPTLERITMRARITKGLELQNLKN